MKVPAISRKIYYPYYVRKKDKISVRRAQCENLCNTSLYFAPGISFGYANSGKLKTLFSYGLPCMYTGIEMIDPKKVQKMLKNNIFETSISNVLKRIEPFEKSLQTIELRVYNLLKEQAEINPEKNVNETIQDLVPFHKKELRRRQSPILQELIATSRELPEEYRYKFKQFIDQAIDKLNDQPIKVDFSRAEFKYDLEKIQCDIDKKGNYKASKAMKKLIEVSEFLTTKDIEISIEDKLKTLDFMEIILRSSVIKDNQQLQKLFKLTREKLNGEKMLVPFSRKGFIYDLGKVLTDLPDEDLKEQMIYIAEKLPTSRDTVSAYIMKHRHNPSEKIIYKLLWPSLASIEHIHPRACGGEDTMANYGGACTRANSDRSSIPFTNQIKLIPNVKENCQKYVDRLIELARQGVFDTNKIDKKYIEEFKMAVLEESEGQINLDITKFYEL